MTYGAMQVRIAGELERDDITTEIQDAIKTAIKHFADERFWFNENNNDADSVTTTTNSTTYTISLEWLEVDELTVEVSSNEYPLIPRTLNWFKEVNTNAQTVVGIPTDYAFHADAFLLYPTPNGSYPLRIYGLNRITQLDSVGDITLTDSDVTNAWFTFGEDLIRSHAKAVLQADVTSDPPGAMVSAMRADDAYAKLKRKSRRKIATGNLQPTDW